MIAQATAASQRQGVPLPLPPGLDEDKLCRILSTVLDVADRLITHQPCTFSQLSGMFRVQLGKDETFNILPPFFVPLIRQKSRAEQDKDASKALHWLLKHGIISGKVGDSDDERLENAAKAVGVLSFRNSYHFPDNLSDYTLLDLLKKLTTIEIGRVTPVRERRGKGKHSMFSIFSSFRG